MATPLRIRDDLVPWVEAESAALGISIPALVNSLIERASVQGRLAEARPEVKPPGLSSDADKEFARDQRILLTYLDPATPWPLIVAGSVKEVDKHSLDLEVFPHGPIVRLPRIWLVTWHVPGPNDDFGLMITRAARLYQGIGMRLNPLVQVQHKLDAVVEVLPPGTRAIIRFRRGDGTLWVIAGQVTNTSGNTRYIRPDGAREVPLDITSIVDTPETYADPQKAALTVVLWEREGYRVHPSLDRAWGVYMKAFRT